MNMEAPPLPLPMTMRRFLKVRTARETGSEFGVSGMYGFKNTGPIVGLNRSFNSCRTSDVQRVGCCRLVFVYHCEVGRIGGGGG